MYVRVFVRPPQSRSAVLFSSSSEPFRGARGRGVCAGDGAQADAHPAGSGGKMKRPSRAEDGWTELWGTSDGCKHREEPTNVPQKEGGGGILD